MSEGQHEPSNEELRVGLGSIAFNSVLRSWASTCFAAQERIYELTEALRAVHAPYKMLTEDALEAGILMEFGPPRPDRGAAQLLVRAALAKADGAAQ